MLHHGNTESGDRASAFEYISQRHPGGLRIVVESYTGFWVTRDQSARFAVTAMTSIPSWNLTPPMTFGN
jgi:hypothetical protein